MERERDFTRENKRDDDARVDFVFWEGFFWDCFGDWDSVWVSSLDGSNGNFVEERFEKNEKSNECCLRRERSPTQKQTTGEK